MNEVSAEDLQELLEIADKVVSRLLSIESKEYLLVASDYDEIFRGLHNLKGTFAMLGLTGELISLVQETETLFEKNKDKDQIETSDFHVLYKASTEIHEFLESGKIPKTFEQIKKCSFCLEDPLHNKPEACRNNEKNLIDYNEGLGIFKMIQIPKLPVKEASILVIKSSFKSCPYLDQLSKSGVAYDRIDCFSEIEVLRGRIQHYKALYICVDDIDAPLVSVLRTINILNKKIHFILYGRMRELPASEDYSQFIYTWIGTRNRASLNTFIDLVQKIAKAA